MTSDGSGLALNQTIAAVAMILVLVGAGCASTSASERSLPSSTTAPVDESTEENPSSDDGDDPERAKLDDDDTRVLTERVGVYVHTNQEFEDSIRHKQDVLRQRDDVIANCMSTTGFQYFPDAPEVVVSFYDGFDEERNTREWAEIYGFGITTLRYQAGTVGPRITGYPGNPPARPPDSDEESDPFNNYLVSLGEDGQAEYWTALYGTTPKSADFSEEKFMASCAGQAEIAVPEFENTDNVQLASVDPTGLLDRAEASPEFIGLEQQGSRCLRDAGHDFSSEVDARGSIVQAEFDMDQRLGFIGDPANLQGTAADDFIESMQAIQEQEIEAALAVWDCGVAEPQLRALLGDLVVEPYQTDG